MRTVASLGLEGFHVFSILQPKLKEQCKLRHAVLVWGATLKKGQGELDNQLRSFCSDLANMIPKHLIKKACHRTKPKTSGAETCDPRTLRQVTCQGVGMSNPTAKRE